MGIYFYALMQHKYFLRRILLKNHFDYVLKGEFLYVSISGLLCWNVNSWYSNEGNGRAVFKWRYLDVLHYRNSCRFFFGSIVHQDWFIVILKKTLWHWITQQVKKTNLVEPDWMESLQYKKPRAVKSDSSEWDQTYYRYYINSEVGWW